MTAHIDSYFSRTLAETRAFSPLGGDITVDTAVIGGGLAGCATALSLAERGGSVALVESCKAGWGASGRNGGFASESFLGGYMALAGRVGLERAREFQAIARHGLELVRKRIASYAIQCGPVREGALRCNVQRGGEDLERFRDFMARNFDVSYDIWPRERLREALSTDKYQNALFISNTLSVHPLNLTRGMARACAEAGVQVFEETRVNKIVSRSDGKELKTANGSIRAGQVVIACGGYIDGLQRSVSAGTVPIASFVMATEPLGERLKDAIRVPYAIFDNTVATNYYRPLADTRILWGGRVLAWQPNSAKIGRLLKADMVRHYPSLANARVDVAWGGMMPYTRHRLPVIGQVERGVWYATGFGGLGVTLTSAAGDIIARGILEGDPTWRLFEAFGLPFAGGKLGKIPAQMIYWSHRIKAMIGHPGIH